MSAPGEKVGEDSDLVLFEIGHHDLCAVIDPDNGFWSLISKSSVNQQSQLDQLSHLSRNGIWDFTDEMERLRFGLTPSAVYFNPTERCNLNCSYCYLPASMRRSGSRMSTQMICDALSRLGEFLSANLAEGEKPQVIFHGSEPMMNKHSVFAAIERFQDDFIFGIQTNATLLDDYALEFITSRNISLGLSLDGPTAEVNDLTRHSFTGTGSFDSVIKVLNKLRGYRNYAVITTVTTRNLPYLSEMVELFHRLEVPTCMLNPVRCTLDGALEIRPGDVEFAESYLKALERSRELYLETGRKVVVANFANAVIGIVAPTARRMMCDISPCGAGRCFFAVDAKGDLFPCSEFIGLPEFNGGNMFQSSLDTCLDSEPSRSVTERKIEEIEGCSTCPIRHFCGAPCPAEAYHLNGEIGTKGAFCHFYKEQARFIFRAIADGIENDYLWDKWDIGLSLIFDMSSG